MTRGVADGRTRCFAEAADVRERERAAEWAGSWGSCWTGSQSTLATVAAGGVLQVVGGGGGQDDVHLVICLQTST